MTRVRHAAVAVTLVAMALAVGPANLGAQSIEQFDKTYGFIGHWDTEINNPDGQDRGNCGGRKGDWGEKLLNCAMPIDQLPLNGRGEAWLKYMDHRQSPVMAECAQLAVPALLSADSYWNAALTEIVIYLRGSFRADHAPYLYGWPEASRSLRAIPTRALDRLVGG